MIHELLVYLPRLTVKPEAVITLRGSFRDLFDEHRPSIILGSLFNAFEFDFLDIVKQKIPDLKDVFLEEQKNIVLQLALCDRGSPVAWAVLAHEMGHAIDRHHAISETVADGVVKDKTSAAYSLIRSWCGELCADLVASQVLGPPVVLSLLSLQYCVYHNSSIYHPSRSHPSTFWRFEIVSSYLKDQYGGLDLLAPEASFLEKATEYAYQIDITDEAERERTKNDNARAFDSLIRPLADRVIKETRQLDLPQHSLEFASLERCKERLKNKSPISAQGQERRKLCDAVAEYKGKEFSSIEEHRGAFYKLVDGFKEQPLPIQTILTSAWLVRADIINELMDSVGALRKPETLHELCGKLTVLDEITISSINRSWIHQRISRTHA